MKISLNSAIALIVVFTFFIACNDDETYAEQKERENKQINSFIEKHNIDIISMNEFLKDTITSNPETGPDKSRNEYVLFNDNGVYMQIVRRGQGRLMEPGETWFMNARYTEVYVSSGDTLTMNTLNSYPESLYVKRTGDTYTGSFTYGIMATRYGNAVPNSWIMIFPFIKPGFLNGDPSAKVRLIVPHSEGTQTASSNVYPTFYEITISTEKWQSAD